MFVKSLVRVFARAIIAEIDNIKSNQELDKNSNKQVESFAWVVVKDSTKEVLAVFSTHFKAFPYADKMEKTEGPCSVLQRVVDKEI